MGAKTKKNIEIHIVQYEKITQQNYISYIQLRLLFAVTLVIYTPFISNSPTGQITHHIFTLNGSNDVDSCKKGVPFLTLVDIAAHLGDQIAPKPQFLGRE